MNCFKLIPAIIFLTLPTTSMGQYADVLPIDHHYYFVSGKTEQSNLSIRQEPTFKSSIIGVVSYDEEMVEVAGLSKDQKWGLVNTSSRTGPGWVEMKFLRKQYPPTYGTTNVPVGLKCRDVNSEWSITTDRWSVTYDVPGVFQTTYVIRDEREFRNPNTIVLVGGKDNEVAFDFSDLGGVCRDEKGLAFPWTINIHFPDERFSGCCSLK